MFESESHPKQEIKKSKPYQDNVKPVMIKDYNKRPVTQRDPYAKNSNKSNIDIQKRYEKLLREYDELKHRNNKLERINNELVNESLKNDSFYKRKNNELEETLCSR